MHTETIINVTVIQLNLHIQTETIINVTVI